MFLIAKIQIRPNGEGISVYAPSLGLHEVYFDKNSWKVIVTSTMDNLGMYIKLYFHLNITFFIYISEF